jgi:transposase-like protein
MQEPKTLREAIQYFSDAENCRTFMVSVLWPDGVVRCPRCGSDTVAYLENAKLYFCRQKHAKQKFSLKVGTIFEESPIGLEKWLPAFWLLVNCKNGISSYELARAVGVTQKSAWFMLHRIRESLGETTNNKIGGTNGGQVEIDETFVGGKVRNMHKSRRPKDASQGGKGKAVVLGMLERGGKVRAKVIKDRTKINVAPVVKNHIADGSRVITDEFSVYPFVLDTHTHEVINHAMEYVRDHVHTNGIENFWSLLKRGLNGTYVSVEPFHLDAYVVEQVFRFNNRATKDNPLTDADRFALAMSQVAGRRLTYAKLTGKEAADQSFSS